MPVATFNSFFLHFRSLLRSNSIFAKTNWSISTKRWKKKLETGELAVHRWEAVDRHENGSTTMEMRGGGEGEGKGAEKNRGKRSNKGWNKI